MNWIKIFAHDVRCGLLRPRYILILIIFLIPCVACYSTVKSMDCSRTWIDYMIYSFQGLKPINVANASLEFHLPINWLLIMTCCMFLNLDYMLSDMTNFGQQVIIRCKNRTGWFLSKCMWNLCSTLMYFCCGWLTMVLFALITGGRITMENAPQISGYVFSSIIENITDSTFNITKTQVLIYCMILPMLSTSALNLLQMTLCLYVKPILSFITIMCILVLSLFWHSPLALGNGAMLLRNALFFSDGIKPVSIAIAALSSIVICVFGGTLKFKKANILSMEE